MKQATPFNLRQECQSLRKIRHCSSSSVLSFCLWSCTANCPAPSLISPLPVPGTTIQPCIHLELSSTHRFCRSRPPSRPNAATYMGAQHSTPDTNSSRAPPLFATPTLALRTTTSPAVWEEGRRVNGKGCAAIRSGAILRREHKTAVCAMSAKSTIPSRPTNVSE